MLRQTHIAASVAVLLLITACGSDGGDGVESSLPNQKPSVSQACADAFATAASVSEYQDTHEDLFPAYSVCASVEEWKTADELHPDAIDGVDPFRYAMTVCANYQKELGNTPICRAVNAPSPADASNLKPSGNTGQLGVSLPDGAELMEETPGEAAEGQGPSQKYAISATAAQIAAFFNREMPRAGWAKDGTSTKTALFFRKGNLMIGVLINRDGGTFTLMGSQRVGLARGDDD